MISNNAGWEVFGSPDGTRNYFNPNEPVAITYQNGTLFVATRSFVYERVDGVLKRIPYEGEAQ